MIQSMTGFGKATGEWAGKKITVEIKSLNSKSGISISSNIPSRYKPKELELNALIKEKLHRGKIDYRVSIESPEEQSEIQLNEPALKNYVKAFKNLGLKGVGSSHEARLLQIAMQQPDATVKEKSELEEEEFQATVKILKGALENLNEFRTSEGEALKNDFEKHIAGIKNLLRGVEEIDPDRKKEVRSRLNKALKDLNVEVDENRFEQELIFYLEKYDITEEKIRLTKHLEYFQETLEAEEPNGKKLKFIGQEIGREINTIGSKSNHAAMQKCVVQMKDELEKIKEQVLNVL